MGRFDWVVGFEYGWANTDVFPESILCEPTYLPALLTYVKRRWPTPPAPGNLLAVAVGPDFLLSWQRKRVMAGLGDYFSYVYYEAKDIGLPGVDVMPTGFTEHYTRANADRVLERAVDLQRSAKPEGSNPTVLAAWGAWWPGLDALIPDRARAREFAATCSLVTEEQFTSEDYFEALSSFDFMLCPLGNGIQSPKIMEALLMGCIPIATRHSTIVELQQRGMPILIVEDWTDITDDLLRKHYPTLFSRAWEFRNTLLDLDRWWEFSFPNHPRE
jgi:hypothetical protein